MSPVCFDLYDSKIVKIYIEYCNNAGTFPFQSQKGQSTENYLDIKVIVTQLSICVFQTHQTKNTVTSETQLWLHTHTRRKIFTHKKSLSPQALSCKTCLLEMDLDIGALSVRIFSPNTRQFLQRTKPHQCSHAHLSCIVSKALLCSFSLSLI